MNSAIRIIENILLAASSLTLAVTGMALLAHRPFPHTGELHEIAGILFIVAAACHIVICRKGLIRSLRHPLGIVLVCAVALALVIFLMPRPAPTHAAGQSIADITLPAADTRSGMPLYEALSKRQSRRSFSDTPLTPRELSQIFWSAFGVNRAESGKRTAPSARNWQEIELYAFTKDGVYRYDAKRHVLAGVISGDHRLSASTASFAADAPLIIVYAADRSKAPGSSDEMWAFFSAVDTGFISQNVYLAAEAEGLSTVVLGSVDRKSVSRLLNFSKDKTVLLAQPVGHGSGS